MQFNAAIISGFDLAVRLTLLHGGRRTPPFVSIPFIHYRGPFGNWGLCVRVVLVWVWWD